MSAPLFRAFVAIVLAFSPALASAQGLRVVARVNDDAITDFELNQRILFAVRSAGMQESADMHQRLSAQLLRQMVDERLQIQHAKGLGVPVSEAETNQRVAEIERGAGMPRGGFRQYLEAIKVPYEVAVQPFQAQLAWAKIIRRRIRPQV